MDALIAQVSGHLTGASACETVSIWGTQEPESPLWRHVFLQIDGPDGLAATTLKLPWDAGYDPRLCVGSMTDRTREDVLVAMDSGGSGGIGLYALYRWDGGAYRLAFDSEAYNAASAYRVQYVDQYAVRADSLQNRTAYLIDISNRGEAYLDELYAENGALRKPQTGWVDPVGLLYPADVDHDGLLELVAWQRVCGLYHADALGHFINTLAWDGERFALSEQTLGIIGVEI